VKHLLESTTCKHPDAVRWNQHNGVVQCHVCGQVWVPLHGTPEVLYQDLVEAEQARLHDAVLQEECTPTKFYMLRDNATGLYYRRIHNRGGESWVKQKEASVWASPDGPRACLGTITRRNRGKMPAGLEIVPVVPGLPAITLVDGDDWEGLYLDGKLVQEGHHVRLEDIFRHLGIEANFVYPDTEWLEARGNLPENLREVRES